jgi:dihydrofolate synthase/folylpolyglutamate synthase
MIRITTFAQAEAYLLGTIDESTSPRTSYKLDRMYALLRHLGNPHRKYPTIHVGGTSGKGSTSTMIAAVLQAAGKRTGLHTKPHLNSMTERARIDDVPVAPERFAELLDRAMPAIEATRAEFGRPTYYETLLALTFAYFAEESVDVAVIEVGLGGRLDGTNVIVPVVAAITSVGYDHTDVLGDTIEAIAREKAGIAKKGVPLVLGRVPAEAAAVIGRCAAELGAPLYRAADAVQIAIENVDPARGARLRVTSGGESYTLEMPVLGIFQRANAVTAIAVLERLGEGLRPGREAIVAGFARLTIPGRMELIASTPPVVFDIAHNAEKAESLVESLRESFAGRRVHYVVAIGESKDARRILQILASLPSTFTFTTFSATGRRALRPSLLASIAESFGSWGRAIGDPVEALTVVVAGLRQWYVPANA